MAYVGKWGTFVHIPKCAGLAIRHHLDTHLYTGEEIGDLHGMPLEIKHGFAVVRHPIAWLRSFWAYRTNEDWALKSAYDYNWPIIVSMTQWAAGLSWDEFCRALFAYGLDIPAYVFGMYRHPNVRLYQLEYIGDLFGELSIPHDFTKIHETVDKPEVAPAQVELLHRACQNSISEYGYTERDLTSFT